MTRLKIAVVGAGVGRAQSWMSTLRKLSQLSDLYQFTALCEAIPKRARENAERWGVKGFTNLLAMLDEAKPDVVLNCAPSDSNSMVLGLCAPRGVNLITEIPIAPTLGIGDWMMAMAKEHGIKLEITEQVYLWAREQLKRKILDSGIIGEITHARLWYVNKADYHGLNGVRMLIGSEARRVLGYTGRAPVPHFVGYEGDLVTEDAWDAAIIEFDSGVVCLFEDPPRGRLTARWDIEGSEGQIVGSDLYIGPLEGASQHYPFRHEYTEANGTRILDHVRVDTSPPIVFENPYKEYQAADDDEVARMQLLVGFHRAVTEDTEPEYGPQNARKDLELLFALRESARLGNAWVELPLRGPTELEKRLEEEFLRLYGHSPFDAQALAGVRIPRGGVRWRVAGWD
ncbi:MAG: Gfo/Idh/MocA family oxidoreductase [Anaerolineae bacterium]|nr:Gfo/Idh/MocA family oxidoreductase [Anaerolineae bacterium]